MRWKPIWLSLVFAFWWEGCLCLKGSDLILLAKAKAAEEKLNPTTEEVIVGEDGNTTTVVVKKPLLTGIPQKDYIHDPNLPRELKGHNLTNYPFYNGVPEDIEFECDGLHDGFYASVPHHCQVYHHCLFGTRYDFLCANYTAFDQKTFICHFVSEVDCANSPKYFVRNEALYKAASSAPPPTTTTTTTTTTKPTTTTRKPRRRRPARRRRPYYDYYYDSEEYDDEYYDDEEDEPLPPPRKSGRKQRPSQGRDKMNRRRQQGGRKRPSRYEDDEYEDEEEERPRRKGSRKDDDYRRHRNRKGGYRDEDDDRPMRGGSRKRYQEEVRRERRPPAEYEYYDDEEEEEEKYERQRPRKPEKRTRTTTKKYERTTEAPDEEYEEYEDEEDLRPNKKDVTTPASHRFSTSSYKNIKSTTSRPSVTYKRAKPNPESERRHRPISKRVESSTEETTTFKRPIVMKPTVFPDRKFTSIVGTPTGFRKQEEKNTAEAITEAPKEEEKTESARKPQDQYRKFSNFRRQQDEERKENNNSRFPSTSKAEEKILPTREKDNSAQKAEETFTSRNPVRAEDNTATYRSPSLRNQEFTSRNEPSRNEEMNTTPRTPQRGEEQTQIFRKQQLRGYDSLPRNEGNTNPSRNNYRDESAPPTRIFPSRVQESQSEQNTDERTNNAFRTPTRNEEQSFRSPTIQQEQRLETPMNHFRNPYRQEENTNNYRNPTATADEVQYRAPTFRNEDTLINYRAPSAIANSNYRNPHTSADEAEYKPTDEPQYKISSFIPNDAYQRQEVKWPPKEESFIPIQPTVQPPLENKPYITGPGADQTQEGSGKSGYPPAITSPPRGYRRYSKMKVSVRPKPVTEENVEYNKYPIPVEGPKVEFTAPGPSAPQATPRPYLDLEEYDVTLNDALQPSTPYSRLKSRGYQSSVTNPSYRTGYLLTAASQTYPSKISSDYEAVVVPAQRFSTKRRPHEWYW
ncbi:trichohyalin isoform X2 [Halyomorpha halys]|uniref:trichohyalin isoform X2 n=1 Tax=Halyomorpha halys TaxID=286706 RepID=UPI0006D4CD3D